MRIVRLPPLRAIAHRGKEFPVRLDLVRIVVLGVIAIRRRPQTHQLQFKHDYLAHSPGDAVELADQPMAAAEPPGHFLGRQYTPHPDLRSDFPLKGGGAD